MRDCQDAYLREVHLQRKTAKPGEEIIVAKLSSKKCGQPVLLGEKHLQELIVGMKLRATPFGTSAVIGVGLGILIKERARSVLQHMGFTKRRASSKSKVTPDNLQKSKSSF